MNGNGKIDARDYLLLKRAYFGTVELDDVMMFAADVDGDGEILTYDYIAVKRHYFDTLDIYETYLD